MPECKGLGKIYTDLAFMDTVTTVCDACEGRRYNTDVLEKYRLNDKNISDVLQMPVEESISFFEEQTIQLVLKRLKDVGLSDF